ncbi:uncharacterized protein LOC118512282 isoform X2 [Anopheles stephensi]|uniref:uncharacterized protein LOC118512282 isoform X2 n=1 Tax=Anopheles stephensi TaxID=30069 RepID=UPI001658B8C8|nr:uncharacterized protein LOC118512282 isoform X2 [Anopheles stephensi]
MSSKEIDGLRKWEVSVRPLIYLAAVRFIPKAMGSYSTAAFVLQVLLALVPTITALEESHASSGSQATNAPVQCNVCWSLVSAAQCQNSSKSEPCSPEQLDSTVSKLRMIHPQTPDGSLPAAGQVPYRCFTLSATAGNGEAKQVFYAKGCTTTTADLCAGWAKAKSERAACTLCTGNNCNTAAPMEQPSWCSRWFVQLDGSNDIAGKFVHCNL